MARTVAQLPSGTRITDFISLGVLTKTFPLAVIQAVLSSTGKASVRQRELPAHVVVYYVIALALYMQSCCVASLRAFNGFWGPTRQLRWRANLASLRRVRAWGGNRSSSFMTRS